MSAALCSLPPLTPALVPTSHRLPLYCCVDTTRRHCSRPRFGSPAQPSSRPVHTCSLAPQTKISFIGTEFVIYDKGAKPKEANASNPVRAELGIVLYEYNVLVRARRLCFFFWASACHCHLEMQRKRAGASVGKESPEPLLFFPAARLSTRSRLNISFQFFPTLLAQGTRGPRKMTTVIPSIDERGQRAVWQPMKDEDGMVRAGERERALTSFALCPTPLACSAHAERPMDRMS